VLLGGAGLVTCITFVWFSAPDLALTQLLVEVVTTVLILLGLRWLPKRFEEIADDKRSRRRASAPRRRATSASRWRRRRHGALAYAVMTRRDPQTHRRLLPRATPTPRAAAPTSST
jgi:multicomponent K+:H+ antiporter subunit A